MDPFWPNTAAASWSEVVSLLLGVGTAVYGLYLFRNSNKIRRTDLLKTLLDEYNGKPVTDSIKVIEEKNVVFDGKMPLRDPSISLAEPALLFFSKVCYLRQLGLMDAREFAFFKGKIEDVLDCKSIYEYVDSCAKQDTSSPYKRLLPYKRSDDWLKNWPVKNQGGENKLGTD